LSKSAGNPISPILGVSAGRCHLAVTQPAGIGCDPRRSTCLRQGRTGAACTRVCFRHRLP